jgi:hypothetical protein
MNSKLTLGFLVYSMHARMIVNAIMLCTPRNRRLEFADHMARKNGHYSETLWLSIFQ